MIEAHGFSGTEAGEGADSCPQNVANDTGFQELAWLLRVFGNPTLRLSGFQEPVSGFQEPFSGY
jgi:hypothetical protein